jgi:hypothetical protein
MPSSTIPFPTALTALSAPPGITFTSCESPVSSAACFVNVPATAVESNGSGKIEVSISNLSQTSFDQFLFFTLSRSVPAASE